MNLTRVIWARLGVATGTVVSSAGVWVEFGFGWALMLGGAAMAAAFLLIYDVDQR